MHLSCLVKPKWGNHANLRLIVLLDACVAQSESPLATRFRVARADSLPSSESLPPDAQSDVTCNCVDHRLLEWLPNQCMVREVFLPEKGQKKKKKT